MTTFEQILNEIEIKSRAHRFVNANVPETLDYYIKGQRLTPGFLYGYEFKDECDKKNYSNLLGNVSSSHTPPSPISIQFGVEPELIDDIDYCYSASSLNAIEKLMDAHIQNGHRFFILSSLQYFTLESDMCYSSLSDSISFLKHMVQNRWKKESRPIVLITIPTSCDEILTKNKMLNAFLEDLF
ncbi:hypothetical protein BM525_21675 (plasmid) [Alteromonas mediterranea]|uniref:Uncharacterized protein n=1 Tax=Alteromonas mediterranea TaxID=314275 RepID=A0AAC9JG07_9ALTE|nr:hypothetical protein [Alteromonas mediterranea]APD92472.1 hypothetical protein BM524_21455 [Alteromonas mediterranea]APE00333.1 hypothetical protein BM525_21675 [Alteromonas mediterranea]